MNCPIPGRHRTRRLRPSLGSLGFAALCVGASLLPACSSSGSNAGEVPTASSYQFSSAPVIAAALNASTSQLSTTSALYLGGTFTGAVGLFAIDENGVELNSTVSYGQNVTSIQLSISFIPRCTDVLLVFAHDSGNGQGTLISTEAFQVKPRENRSWSAVFPELLDDVSATEPPSDEEALVKYLRALFPDGFVIAQPQVPGKPKLRPDGSSMTGPVWALEDLKLGGPCHGWDAANVWADVFFVDSGQPIPNTEMRSMTQVNGLHPLLPYRHGSLRLATDNPTATGDAYLVVVIEEDPVNGGANRYSIHRSQRFDPGISQEIELTVTRQPTLANQPPSTRLP